MTCYRAHTIMILGRSLSPNPSWLGHLSYTHMYISTLVLIWLGRLTCLGIGKGCLISKYRVGCNLIWIVVHHIMVLLNTETKHVYLKTILFLTTSSPTHKPCVDQIYFEHTFRYLQGRTKTRRRATWLGKT